MIPAGDGAAPSVAILIAAKDSAGTIRRAVRAALAQRDCAEAIVVDDGSTDATADLAWDANDGSGRLQVLRLPENRGPSAARNMALAASTAPIVCVLDADDDLIPDRISRLLATAGEGWDLVADDLLILPEGAAAESATPLMGLQAPVTLGLEDFILANMADPRRPRRELGYLKPLMRRAFLDRHGLRYAERVRLGEDYLLYAAALARGARFRLVPACGYLAVTRAGSLSHNHSADDLWQLAGGEDELLREVGGRISAAESAAFHRHRAHVLRKYRHRMALEAKRDRRLLDMTRHLFATPGTALHIARETLRARWPRGRSVS